MEKDPSIKIIQIAPHQEEGKDFSRIFGLGSDSKVYYWNAQDHEWHLYFSASS
jgi:hypothetical protein